MTEYSIESAKTDLMKQSWMCDDEEADHWWVFADKMTPVELFDSRAEAQAWIDLRLQEEGRPA